MRLAEDELLLNISTKIVSLWPKPYTDFTASPTSLERESGFKKQWIKSSFMMKWQGYSGQGY